MRVSNNKISGYGFFIFTIILLVIAYFGLGREFFASKIRKFSELEKENIHKIIEDYIIDNPEIIVSSFEKYTERKREKMMDEVKQKIDDNKKDLSSKSSSVIIGNPNGSREILYFFDYNCGYCKLASSNLRKLIDEDKDVKLVLKNFPVLGEDSLKISKLAVAVADIDLQKFEVLHKKLTTKERLSYDEVFKFVQDELGINKVVLVNKINSEDVTKHLENSTKHGNRIGLRGTPAFIIGNELIPGAVDLNTLKQKLEEVYGKK